MSTIFTLCVCAALILFIWRYVKQINGFIPELKEALESRMPVRVVEDTFYPVFRMLKWGELKDLVLINHPFKIQSFSNVPIRIRETRYTRTDSPQLLIALNALYHFTKGDMVFALYWAQAFAGGPISRLSMFGGSLSSEEILDFIDDKRREVRRAKDYQKCAELFLSKDDLARYQRVDWVATLEDGCGTSCADSVEQETGLSPQTSPETTV